MTTFDPASIAAPVRDLIQSLLTGGAPGAVASVTRGGLSATAAGGVGDLGDTAAANPGQTYDIASRTKMFTAVTVLQLADEGRVDLDGRIADYLTGSFIDGVPNAGTATVRDALAMRTAIPNYTDAEDPDGVPLFVGALIADPEGGLLIAGNLDIALT